MAHWASRLAALGRAPAHVVGLLSGTSADAIDAAVCRITPPDEPVPGTLPRVELIAHTSHPHDPDVHGWIAAPESLSARHLAELHVRVGERFGEACLQAIEASGVGLERVDLVGSHGQTLYHHSHVPGAARCTLQVGDGDAIAELTGLPVVSDFRSRDIAAGGEGAPITPIADLLLFRPFGPHGRRAVLNLGGIANITLLDADPARIMGFDTGPANALLDRLARRLTGGRSSFDHDGRLAASGTVDPTLLERLLADDPFLKRSPPKSTGFEMYGDAMLDTLIARRGGADSDLLATLAEFTAQAIGRALADHVASDRRPGELVIAGGGALNVDLVRRISAAVAPCVVTRSDALGVPSQAREAMAFAILAYRTALGEPCTWPAMTGVRHPVVLGKLSVPTLR
jgi:anhydro-N-acetylmuramic acid kinase